MTPRTLVYVTTEDLGLRPNEAESIAQSIDVTYGDARYTIVHRDGFQDGVESALSLTRGAAIRDKLLALNVQYVAFLG